MSSGGRVLEVCRRFNLSGQGPVYHSTMSLGEIHCNSSNLAAKCLCFVANKALSIRHFCERGDALLSANSSPGIGRKKHKSFEPRRTRRAQRKRKALLCALRVLRGSLLFRAFCDALLHGWKFKTEQIGGYDVFCLYSHKSSITQLPH